MAGSWSDDARLIRASRHVGGRILLDASEKKRRERFYVEEAARVLGKDWVCGPDREEPDFLITEGNTPFGLEISEVFKGKITKNGSKQRREEEKRRAIIRGLQADYEGQANVPLQVKIFGNLAKDELVKIVPRLVSEDLASKSLLHRIEMKLAGTLRVHVTKSPTASWSYIGDNVGYVVTDPRLILDAAIKKKSEKLEKYKSATGADVRLLLFSDRRKNRGKLMLTDRSGFDLCGFTKVYFFPNPEPIMELSS